MNDVESGPRKSRFIFPVAGVLLASAIFALDLSLELGVAEGMLYVAVVSLGLWAPQRRFIPVAGAAGTILTVLGYFLSPPGGELWKVLANRALCVGIIWVTAVFCSLHKRKTDALDESERRFRMIVDNMYNGLIVIDETGTMVSFNPAAERCFGYSASEAVGKNVSILMPEPDKSRHDRYLANYLETGVAKIIGSGREVTARRKDGSLFPIDLFVSKIYEKGKCLFIGIVRDITGRKRAEDALKESENRYHTIFDQLRSILEGTSPAIGERFLRSLVHRLADALQVRYAFIGELTGGNKGRVTLRAIWSGSGFAEPLEYALSGTPCGEVIGHELRHYPRDLRKLFPNDPLLAELEAESYLGVPLFDSAGSAIGHLAVMDDKPMLDAPNARLILSIFAARAQTEIERERTESRLRILSTAVEQSPSSVVIADNKGRVMYVNPNFTQTTGYTLEDAIGQNPRLWKSGIHPPEFYKHLWNTVMAGKEWRSHICNKKKSGELYWELLSILPLRDEKNAITHFIAIKIDDTERRRAEKKMRHYAAELERSNQALQDFAYIASHDLQEPLRKITVFGDRLRERVPSADEAGRDYLDRMQNAASRMQRFIDDLLEYSRVTTKLPNFVPVRLGDLVSDVLSDLEVRIAQSGAKVNVDPLPTIEADELLLRQLFQNLIANAIKFHKKETPPVVTVSGNASQNGFWKIVVEDNGIGFEEKHAERIFKPFERLHSQSEYAGSGIGLAVCQKIVLRHGGNIAAQSAPQMGAKFIITLPEKQTAQDLSQEFPLPPDPLQRQPDE